MSARDAAYRLIHRYPGGVAAMAARMGRNASTLQNKVNPTQPGCVNLDEAEQFTAFSGDPEIAQALALACNHVCVPVAAPGTAGELSPEIAAMGAEFGQLMKSIYDALADGRVTEREIAQYDEKFTALLGAAVRLRAELRARVPRPPVELRAAK